MKTLLKKAIFGIAATSTLLSLGSCQKAEQEQTVSFCLTYNISTDGGQDMPGTKASSADVFDEFYQKIKSGELVAPTYALTFTEKTTGAVYTVNGTWAGKDMVTLRTGTYKVEGTSTAAGENIQDKCSLAFSEDIVIDVNSKTITLTAAYDCSLIIFSDASIANLSNFNGVSSTDLFKFSKYIYAFVNKTLYAEGKQAQSYLAGVHTNGTQFKIYTGNLTFETGKYYVYNDVATDFNIEPMQEGGEEGNIHNLSINGTANCYIVPAAGTYKFNASVKGNSAEALDGTPVKAEVLWETYGTDVKPNVGDVLAFAYFRNGYAYFATPNTFQNGNAVIAVKDASDNILWSWHIWVCKDFDPATTAQVYNNNAGTMMDRNLGATSATPGDVHALGLLYQWGRKDPFIGPSAISTNTQSLSTITWPSPIESDATFGTIDFSIKHPTTFIVYNTLNNDWLYTGTKSTENSRWSIQKSEYDPCPVGYQLPQGGENGIWAKAFGTSASWTKYSDWDSSNKGYNFGSTEKKLGTGVVWYPSAGYLFSYNGCLNHVGIGGSFWSCTPTESYAAYDFITYYNGEICPANNNSHRATGESVRCQKQ